MEIRRQKQILIACRYIPHDQWFITHGDPAWKIKHLKQRILSKSLSLPFDPRRVIQRTIPDDRAPSPITFAPDEGNRPVSPIEFANPLQVRKKRSAGTGQPGAVDPLSSTQDGSPNDKGSMVEGQEDSVDDDQVGEGDSAAVEDGYEEDDEWDDDEDDFDSTQLPPRFAANSRQPQQPLGGRVDPLPLSTPPISHQNVSTSQKKPFNPLAKIAKSVAGSSGTQRHQQQQLAPDPDGDQIDSRWFTLVRFSTGQVLEDDFLLTWYDLMPNELVELHASRPPINFTVSVNLSAILTHSLSTVASPDDKGGKKNKHSHTKSNPLLLDTSVSGISATNPHLTPSSSALAAALTPNALAPHAQQLQQLALSLAKHSSSSSTSPASFFYTSRREITPLPRTDLTAYVQPYWEGWVRALRVVLRAGDHHSHHHQDHRQASRKYAEYAAGMGGGGGVGMVQWEPAMYAYGEDVEEEVRSGGAANGGGDRESERHGHGNGQVHGRTGYGHGYKPNREQGRGSGDGHGGRDRDKEKDRAKGDGSRSRTTLEWRERWAVVRDGAVWLYKDREDPNPTHQLALSTLIALRDAEHLAQSVNSRKEKERDRERARERKSARDKGRSQSRTGDHDRSRQQHAQQHNPHHRRRSTSTPRASTTAARDIRPVTPSTATTATFPHKARTVDTSHADEKERQKALEKANERQRMKEKREKELEALRRWDDLGLTFNFSSKGKEKERTSGGKVGKEKDDGKSRGEEKKGDRRLGSLDRPRENEKEKERERERERTKGRQKERRTHEREQGQVDPRTFIPTSRDEAEAAGMKIVCAKFRSVTQNRKKQPQKPKNDSQLRYTSTGPSLAGEATAQFDSDGYDGLGVFAVGRGQGVKEETIDAYQRYGLSYASQVSSPPPRKSSLPGLGLGLGKLGVTSTVPAASLAPSGQSVSLSRTESALAGSSTGAGTKFAITGLFGKDKESGDDFGGRREKDERKREEKERKAREKEQKQLEKERRKEEKRDYSSRRRDDDDDDFGTGSAMSWKLGKKLPGRPPNDHNRDTASASSTLHASDSTAIYNPSSEVSLSTADSATLRSEEVSTRMTATIKPLPSRPQLTISSQLPADIAVANVDEEHIGGSGSDSSSLSLSSPVFAHSTDSGENDIDDHHYNLAGRDRRGYRYGGYQPPASRQKDVAPTSTRSHADTDDNRSEAGRDEGERGGALKEGGRRIGEDVDKVSAANSRERGGLLEEERRHRSSRTGELNERGEWLVLDLGSDSAFNSLLRIFHRHFPRPISTTFVPPSLAVPVPHTRSRKHEDSSASSPVKPMFSSGMTLDNANELESMRASNASTLPTGVVGSDADDEADDGTNESIDIQGGSEARSIHPQVFSSAMYNPFHSKTASTPALPYPEWRIGMVHRARLLGMREAGRPLALALNGWGRGFEELKETVGMYSRRKKPDEAWGRRARSSFTDNLVLSGGIPLCNDGTRVHEATEEPKEGEREAATAPDGEKEFDIGRRMSLASHVSTIKAPASSSSHLKKQPAAKDVQDNDDDSSAGESEHPDTEMASEGSVMNDTDVDAFADDDYEGGYAYGQDDEDDALAEGLGSFMEDSEEESEIEWLAWTTDLPRQFAVQQQREEIERLRREKEIRDRELEQPQQPLSPMIFSNPFAGQSFTDSASFISQDSILPVRLPPLPPPKTQEEERMQYVQKKRKLEPSATSTSMALPPPSHRASPSTPSPQPKVHARRPSRTLSSSQLSGYHPQRFSNPATLSSPSSSESLGALAQSSSRFGGRMPPLTVNVANASTSKLHSNTISPLGSTFSPINDGEMDISSLDNNPHSSSSHSYPRPIPHRSHSRSVSGSGAGIFSPFAGHARLPGEDEDWDCHPHRPLSPPRSNALHHSASMPLTRQMPVPMSPIAPSSPRSPINRWFNSPIPQPTSVPIVTHAQINQIDFITGNRILAEQVNELPSTRPPNSINDPVPPSTSPPSSFGNHLAAREPPHHSLPRRLSASSPPSNSMSATGSLERSASVLVKPSQPPSDKAITAERNVLRKKRSDLGKPKGEDQTSALFSQQVSTLSGSTNIDSSSPNTHIQDYGLVQRTTVTLINRGASNGSGSTTTLQTAKALLRRVRSGSSLGGHDVHIEEASPHPESQQGSWSNQDVAESTSIDIAGAPSVNGDRSPASLLRELPPTQPKKKKNPMDRIVRGLDSALEFVEGR